MSLEDNERELERGIEYPLRPRMDRLLIHPPFADPTQPYLSLPTLKGHLRAKGLDAKVFDANVEAARWLMSHQAAHMVARKVGSRFIDLNRRPFLSFDEAREYRALAAAREKIEHYLGAQPTPTEVFTTRELFFDADQYSLARRRTDLYFEALSAAHWPYRFSFNAATHNVLPWSFELLENYCAEEASPLEALYERWLLPRDEWDWDEGAPPDFDVDECDFIGLSVVFPSQIPEAVYLLRKLRARNPKLFLALGGPAVHQVVTHLDPERKRKFFEWVDAIGMYEGERTLEVLFPLLEQWHACEGAQAKHELLKQVPNLLTLDPTSGECVLGPRETLDLRSTEMPDYSDLDLDRYLAPSRTLLYAPTRGCYWGKCSFCYYGLTETGTAGYREVPVAKAVSELAQLARRHGVKNFYISCDVLSPKYAVLFAQELLDRKLKIRWSSDLKIEKYFTPERAKLLYESGLRSAAFGIESGSDRILDLMRKGVDRETLTSVNRSFHEAGVATEWMTFTDHPDETVSEALDTINWIEEQQEYVDLFIVGEFGLESGSHIAQDPARYGVRRIWYAEGDDLRLYALYQHKDGRRTRTANEEVESEIGRMSSAWELHPYPWAGANSTHHTFLHFLEFGQRAFRSHFQRAQAAARGSLGTPPVAHVAGLREKVRFNVETIEEVEQAFFADWLPKALYTTVPARRSGGTHPDEVAPLSAQEYAEAAAKQPMVRPGLR